MYVDSSPVTAHRFDDNLSAAARRTRLSDAIVSQWLLEQVPSDHRHARGGQAASASRSRARTSSSAIGTGSSRSTTRRSRAVSFAPSAVDSV
jgi:hypothetical protein